MFFKWSKIYSWYIPMFFAYFCAFGKWSKRYFIFLIVFVWVLLSSQWCIWIWCILLVLCLQLVRGGLIIMGSGAWGNISIFPLLPALQCGLHRKTKHITNIDHFLLNTCLQTWRTQHQHDWLPIFLSHSWMQITKS